MFDILCLMLQLLCYRFLKSKFKCSWTVVQIIFRGNFLECWPYRTVSWWVTSSNYIPLITGFPPSRKSHEYPTSYGTKEGTSFTDTRERFRLIDDSDTWSVVETARTSEDLTTAESERRNNTEKLEPQIWTPRPCCVDSLTLYTTPPMRHSTPWQCVKRTMESTRKRWVYSSTLPHQPSQFGLKKKPNIFWGGVVCESCNLALIIARESVRMLVWDFKFINRPTHTANSQKFCKLFGTIHSPNFSGGEN